MSKFYEFKIFVETDDPEALMNHLYEHLDNDKDGNVVLEVSYETTNRFFHMESPEEKTNG